MQVDNKSLTQLNEELQNKITEARTSLDEINANTDDARVQELEDRHDAIMGEVDAIEAKVKRAETLLDVEQRTASFRDRVERSQRDRRPLNDVNRDGEELETATDQGKLYRSAFAKVICGIDKDDLSNEERAALRVGIQRIAQNEQRTLTAGTTTAGGYTVPTELQNILIRVMKDWGPMFDEAICTVIQTGAGNPITLPTIDDTAKSAAAHTEGGSVTDDGGEDPVFGQKLLEAYAFDTEWVRWSFELDHDSIFTMESLLGSLLGERMGRKGNAILTTGTGSSQPNGIVTASSAGVTAAAVAAVTSDELIDLQHSVNAAYRRSPKCRWQFADSTLKAVRKLKDSENRYIFQSANLALGAPATLLDFPYSINDDVPAMAASAKSILFGDMSKYFVRKAGSPVLFVARERFAPDQGILGLFRVDGEIGDANAIKRITMAAS